MTKPGPASMRPPDLPGGNTERFTGSLRVIPSFNEAAGFTRRKPVTVRLLAVA